MLVCGEREIEELVHGIVQNLQGRPVGRKFLQNLMFETEGSVAEFLSLLETSVFLLRPSIY